MKFRIVAMASLFLAMMLSLPGCFYGDIEISVTPEYLINASVTFLSEEIGEDVWWVYMHVDEPAGTRFILGRPFLDRMNYDCENQVDPDGLEDAENKYPLRIVDLTIASPGQRLVIATAADIAKNGPDSDAGIRAILLPADGFQNSLLFMSDGNKDFIEVLMSYGSRLALMHGFQPIGVAE